MVRRTPITVGQMLRLCARLMLGPLRCQQASRFCRISPLLRFSSMKVSLLKYTLRVSRTTLNLKNEAGLNIRPTFFGCNATQAELDDGMPMIIYLPNSPLNGSYLTNVSTYTLGYSRADTQSFLNSMWTTQTRGYPESGQAADSNWGACFACGLVERRRQYQNMTRSSTCETCLTRYCYNAGS